MEVDRTFAATVEQVPAVRRWAEALLPSTCERREDTGLLVDEVTANAARYGRSQVVRVIVAHARGAVRVEVHERGEPVGVIAMNAAAVAEMRLLAELADEAIADVNGLLENGRGLPLVELITGGRWHVTDKPDGRIVSFTLVGCTCQVGSDQ